MAVTTVVNIRNTKDYDVYVGREVKNKYYDLEEHDLANPFVLRRESDRDSIYNDYKKWLGFLYRGAPNYINDVLDSLKGRKLACWCAPKKCHADLLAMLADMTYEERWEWANDNN